MDSFFRTLDLRSTIHEYDFTRMAVRAMRKVVTSEEFEEMESEPIFEYLTSRVELVPFGDFLKRYIYVHAGLRERFSEVTDEAYRRIIEDAFTRNCAPWSFAPTTVKRGAAIRRWLEQDSVQRPTVLALGFGLRMSAEDVSDFLMKANQDADFDPGDPWEMICRFCYRNRLPYARAHALMEAYRSAPEGDDSLEEVLPLDEACTQDELLDWLLKVRAAKVPRRMDARRRGAFLELYRRCQVVVAQINQADEDFSGTGRQWRPEDVGPSEIERKLCDGIPRNESGNLQRMSRSLLNRQFQSKRLTRQRLDQLLKGALAVERFDLITLCFLIASQQEDEDPRQRLRRFMDDINPILEDCGMMGLYPANPYEACVMMCLLTEMPILTYSDIWEMSYGDPPRASTTPADGTV